MRYPSGRVWTMNPDTVVKVMSGMDIKIQY